MIGWGTPPQIALYVDRPLNTVRKWAMTNAVPTACRLSDHVLVLHAPSAQQRANESTRRKDRRRRVA